MSEPFLSPSWFRVAALKPALREDVEVSRHRYRNNAWYVLRDPVSGHTHRVTPTAYQFVGRMDGSQTVDEIYHELAETLAADAPSQNEIVTLMTQLYGAELLKTDAIPDSGELFERHSRKLRKTVLGYLKSPFSFKIPLWNPNRFLDRTAWLFTWMFGVFGGLLWLVLVTAGIVVAATNWPTLTQDFTDQALSLNNLPLLACAYILVKAVHEAGHSYAVKAFGGEVRDVGIMLLVLFPVPYVDASAASALRRKHRRATVAAAGIAVELALSSLAVIGWVSAEPGLFRAFLFNVMLIGGFSTLVFNGNPLLRFDGYYVMTDLLELPNLGQRANKYWAYLTERYAFGVRTAKAEQTTRGERIAFLLFAPASYVYRVMVMIALALVISAQFFVVGTVLAIWALVGGLLLPILTLLGTLLTGPRLRRKRLRAVTVSALVVGGLAVGSVWVPLPSHVTTEGVVWLPEGSSVKAGTSGFIQRVVARPGDMVQPGDPLVEIGDPDWPARKRQIEAKLDELDAQYVAARFQDRVNASVVALERDQQREVLRRELQRQKQGQVISQRAGVFVFPNVGNAPGRYVKEGGVLAYVTPETTRTLRIVVTQDDIDLVRNRIERIEVKLRDQPDKAYDARIVREVPAAASELPSKALGLIAGGKFGTDPRDPNGTKALSRLFQFDLELSEKPPRLGFGTRAYVRFDLVWEPLGVQIYRRARQLFLAHFHA